MIETCSLTYGVTFPLTAKLDVNGPDTHPIYQYLKSQMSHGIWGSSIKRNFTKFLIDRDGCVRKRYAPTTSPKRLEKTILDLLS